MLSTVICSYCRKERDLSRIEFDALGLPVCFFCVAGKRAVESNFNSVIGSDIGSDKCFLDDKQNTLKRWF